MNGNLSYRNMACIRYVAPKGDNKVRHFAGHLKNGSDDVLSSRPACGGVETSTIHITTPKKTPATSTPWDIFITRRTAVTEMTSHAGGVSLGNPGCVNETPPHQRPAHHTPPPHTPAPNTLTTQSETRIDNKNIPGKTQTVNENEAAKNKVTGCGLNTHTDHTDHTEAHVGQDDMTLLDQATAHFPTQDYTLQHSPHLNVAQRGSHSTSGLNETGNASHHKRLADDVIDQDEAKDVVQNITQRSASRSSRCNNNNNSNQHLKLSHGPYWSDNIPFPVRHKPLPVRHKPHPGRGAIKRSISDMALEGRDQLAFFGYTSGDRSDGVGDLDDDDDEWCIDLDQILEQVRSKNRAHRPAHRPTRNGWGNVILTHMGGSEHELNTASPQNEGQHGGSLTSRSDSGVPLVSDRLRTRRFALADPERMIMRQEDRERIEQEVERRRQSIVRRVSQFFNVQLGLNREEDLI